MKDELLNHIINDTKLNFADQTRWCPGGLIDLNPGFAIAEWLTRLLYAYDYIKGTLTPGDRTLLDNWFLEAAKYMETNYKTDLEGKFVDSPNGDYTLVGENGTKTNPTNLESTLGTVLYFNGPATRSTARFYSNRRLAMISFVGLTGIFLKDVSSMSATTTTLRDNSKRFFTEFIRYGIYPTGYYVDFLRGIEDNSPEKGYGYATNGAMIAMADAFARIGDLDLLYNYQNAGGLTTAQVGNVPADATSDGTLKGLKMHMKAMLDLRNQQTTVYATDYGILYNQTANATPPSNSVLYTATSATGDWTNNPANAQTTAIRRASSSYPWTTTYGILYNTDVNATPPVASDKPDNIPLTATSAPGGIDSNGDPRPDWSTSPIGAKKKYFRTDKQAAWVREYKSDPSTSPKLIVQNGNANYKVDGVDAILGGYSVTDVMYSVANMYYRDNYIRDSYTRAAAGSVAYPQNAQNSGSQTIWGALGQYPGILFMFGQMEDNPANPFLPPTVSITAPSNNATYASPATVTLTANANTAALKAVNRVEFYKTVNGTPILLGTSSTPTCTSTTCSYTYSWSTSVTGTYTITAKAITNVGISTTSSAITVIVGPASNKLEAETYYSEVPNSDPDNDISINTCSGTLSNTHGVVLSDAGDAIQIPFTISQSGIYQLRVRVRSGYNGSPYAYFSGTNYTYKVDGVTQSFTGDNLSVTTTLSSCMGNSYWGDMVSGNLSLSNTSHNIVITSGGNQRAVDYLEVIFVTTGARKSSESVEYLPTVTLYPNPFQDQLTIELGEKATGTYQVAVVDALGRSFYAQEHQLKENQSQLQLQLPAGSMQPGLYFVRLNHEGQAPKVIKVVKQL